MIRVGAAAPARLALSLTPWGLIPWGVTMTALVVVGAAPDAAAQVTVDFIADDGVKLATDIYATSFDPQPVVMIRTPGGRGELEDLAWDLATRFDAKIVVQDTRGQGDSGGEDSLFRLAAQDGQATLDWVETLGWSNGTVAGYGAGLDAIPAMMMAAGAPPAYACQYVLGGTFDLPSQGIYLGDVRRAEFDAWAIVQGVSAQIAGWNTHPDADDDYWDPLRLADAELSQVHTAGLHVTGWYDLFLQGALDWAAGLETEGGAGAWGRQHLLIGPWDRDGKTGDLSFPGSDDPETLALWEKAWAADCLHGDEGALDELPAVRLFVMGPDDDADGPGNEWRDYEAWPPPAELVPMYLRGGGSLTTVPPEDDELAVTFEHDPSNPVPAVGGRNFRMANGPKDQSAIEARTDVAVYSSGLIKAPAWVIGPIRADIWVLSAAEEMDVVVRLTDVYPDGRSMLVAAGIQKVRGTGKVQRVKVDLWSTAIAFDTNHRIRLSVSGSMSGAFAVAPEKYAAFIATTPEFPSHLRLSVTEGLEAVPGPGLEPDPIEGAELDSADAGESDTGGGGDEDAGGGAGPFPDSGGTVPNPTDTGGGGPAGDSGGSADSGPWQPDSIGPDIPEDPIVVSDCDSCGGGQDPPARRAALLSWLLPGAWLWRRARLGRRGEGRLAS